jgi:hypothetical protein
MKKLKTALVKWEELKAKFDIQAKEEHDEAMQEWQEDKGNYSGTPIFWYNTDFGKQRSIHSRRRFTMWFRIRRIILQRTERRRSSSGLKQRNNNLPKPSARLNG